MSLTGFLKGTFLDKHTMTPFRQWVKSRLVRITGNRVAQDLLEEIVQTAHILQGVGGGVVGASEVNTSGERAVVDLLKNTCEPPYCILDVGANRGQFLQMLLDHLGTDEYTIHCFEPGHEPFGALCQSHGQSRRIKLNNVGIGKEKGGALLYYDTAGSGCASLTRRNLDHLDIHFDKSEAVTLTTIDDYCSENGIHRIHLLKLDIEGHELDAVIAAQKMFERNCIDIVLFEFGGCNLDTRTFFQDFWYFFDTYDMKLFRITPSGYLYPVEKYSEIHEKFGVSNYVAAR